MKPSLLFEKYKIDKPLSILTKRYTENIKINKIRNKMVT